MKKYKEALKSLDLGLFITILLMIGIGLIAVTSASYPVGSKSFGDGLYFGKRYFTFMIIGFMGMLIAYKFPREFFKRYSFVLFCITIILVLMLFIPEFTKSSRGSGRWLKLPLIPIKLQPSDFVKISSILYMAKVLSENKYRMYKNEVFIKIVAIIGFAVLPIMLKDLSTGLVIGATLMFMYIVGGIYMHQFVTLGGIGVAVLIPMVLKYSYRLERILGFLNSSEGSLDQNYQINQSLYAIAMGGFGGVGYFHSRQKYFNLAEAHNDFIFSVICEEFGFIGGIFVVALFFIFVYKGFKIASKTKNNYDKYVAVGLTSYIGLQAIINISVGVGVFPVTGITLPFISYGGTALMMSMVAAGFLLKISKDV
ncbi:cell division protein FtsW [Peptoniphilus asaccharolyticus DSM 20463]|uniref:Probable peptidoglycan glycosyltransferase FtsW n=1 Tax=Peptoniphilus asaccharolyticus DSM 20463 TaxID=573058 RepID=A0A1W1UXK5_PEPAS|nr:putative peptidoglycan glycosyltransferase FtsW [Peptoniphilus asaccharolyticus]MBL7575291.1 cell division protein FtsW [Peptoniphilus asaccharolyticus]SMB85491.1 cell division protein FtsW [Peptoniphilus asaccharolyticus DSM 20463]